MIDLAHVFYPELQSFKSVSHPLKQRRLRWDVLTAGERRIRSLVPDWRFWICAPVPPTAPEVQILWALSTAEEWSPKKNTPQKDTHTVSWSEGTGATGASFSGSSVAMLHAHLPPSLWTLSPMMRKVKEKNSQNNHLYGLASPLPDQQRIITKDVFYTLFGGRGEIRRIDPERFKSSRVEKWMP